MTAGRRIFVMGGHELDRLGGNEALTDLIVSLAGKPWPRVCLLPTASGDPEDQIARFRRTFAVRDAIPSEISLFRLGLKPIDLREHLLSQDVIYVGGGSLLNLIAIWGAHDVGRLLTEAMDSGVLVCGQSAGAMCWFERGITTSTGEPAPADGLGLLAGSLCVHYHRDPERRARYLAEVGATMPPGYGADDQTGLLFVDGALSEAYTARPGAGIWRVEPDPAAQDPAAAPAIETRLEATRLEPSAPERAREGADVEEYRQLRDMQRGPAWRPF